MSRTPNPYDSFFGLSSPSPASPAGGVEAAPGAARPPREAGLRGSSPVERQPEELGAVGSTPTPGTIGIEPEPERLYPAWALPIQKANCLLGVLHEYGPKACHEVLGEMLDAQDLDGFKDALNAIERVAMAVVCMSEALPYLEQDNPEMVRGVRSFMVPGGLEAREARQKFLEKARMAWRARCEQLGGLCDEILGEEGLV